MTTFKYIFTLSCLLIQAYAWGSVEEKPDLITITSNEKSQVTLQRYSNEALKKSPELSKIETKNDPYEKCILFTHEFPNNKEIIIYSRGFYDNGYQESGRFTIKENGQHYLQGQPVASFLVISSKPYLPGERHYKRFVTHDNSFNHEISFIPNRLVAYDKTGKISIEAELLSLVPTVYRIDVDGLQEGEQYVFRSTSLNEVVKHKATYSLNNSHMVMPGVIGLTGGTAEFAIFTKSNNMIKLPLMWGNMLSEYVKKRFQVK